MKLSNEIITAIYPNVCVGCGEVLENDEYFCDYCFEMLERIEADRVCKKCGLPKKKCECSKYVFHFDGVAAPFKNGGVAQKALYAFKFRHKRFIARFFAEQMALTVKQSYTDQNFDFITYVPMRKSAELQRGYNQSFILAKMLSKILNIPIGINALKCSNKKRKIQHRLSYKDRFKNIKDKFYCDKNLQGKRILLVDDIKTSGATFDECAKQLCSGGAESVFCIAALITYKREENKNGN